MRSLCIKARTIGLAIVLGLLSHSASAADDKPWENDYVGKDVQGICNQHEGLQPPSQDIPTAADKIALKGCSSIDLYYGIGVTKDYTKARKCAFIEDKSGGAKGSSVLMMIYANGYGVNENIDFAIKEACMTDGAPAEVEDRVNALNDLKSVSENCIKSNPAPAKKCENSFDFCNYVTSGALENYCESIRSAVSEQENLAEFKKLISKWPEKHQASFDNLDKAASSYFDVHANKEMDLTGSGWYAFLLDEKDTMTKEFRESVKTFESGKFPAYSAEDFTKADKALNVDYAAALKKIPRDHGTITGITKDGIRKTEKAWLNYRDAWVKFAALHYPAVSQQTIETWLTLQRSAVIKEIPLDD